MPPSDALVIAVTTGLGVSVIAGLLSGICYILNQGVSHERKKRPRTPWHCNVCQAQFRSIQGVLEIEKVVTCAKCNEKICRVKCSIRDPQKGWICQLCQQPETWFKGLLNAMHPSSAHGWFSTKMDSDVIDELDEDLMELRKKEREQVRDFIERLVESLLGGDLDDVSVTRIYNDKKYDALFARYHADLSNALTDLGSALHISISNLPITGQSPCTAHASLKLLIQRFIREAVELPELKRQLDHPALPEEQQSDRTYEDLLSTAIINKVVQNYQIEAKRSHSSANSVCSRASSSTKKSDKEYFFSEETLEAKWRTKQDAQDETSSTSSIDEWLKSDSSVGSSKFVDRVSLTIKQQIDEGSSSDEGSRKSHRSLLKTEETWDDNWFLQKRIAGTHSPVPVPMLVPNPTGEAKVLIGDRDAEDTSDLSDACSDFGDTEVVPDIKNILVNSRTIIGGKNVLEKAVVDATRSVDQNKDGDVEENKADDVKLLPEAKQEEAKTEKVTNEVHPDEAKTETDEKIEDASMLSLDSNTEQDTEYTEQYGSLPRTILKSPKPTPRASKITEVFKEDHLDSVDGRLPRRDVQNTVASDGDVSESSDDDDDDKSKDIRKNFKGSYSEREKEKWKHAVEIPNNPYAPEKLESRLSSRSDDSAGSLYGRDYYIREASRSTGARKKTDQTSQDIEHVDLITFDDESNEKTSESLLVTAIPVFIQSEDEVDSSKTPTQRLTPSPIQTQKDETKEEEEEKPIPNWNSFPRYTQGDDSLETAVRPNHLEISSDSDLSIERIYNLESGRVIQKVGQISQEILMGSKSPEGIRYTPKEFDEDFHFRKAVDENHNDTGDVHAKKRQFLRSLTQEDDETVFIQDSPVEDDKTVELILEKEEVPYTILSEQQPTIKLVLDEEEEEERGVIPPPKSFGEMKKLVDNKEVKTSDYSEDDVLSESKDFSLEYSTDLGELETASPSDSLLETDPEILDLKEKKLVKDALGRFSKSFPNLPPRESEEEVAGENPVDMPSVRHLKKLFDRESILVQPKKDQKQVYSLTARSIPKQFRQELKSHDEKSVPNEDLTANGSDAGQDNEEELPMDITKNRIAFFEKLKKA